MRGTVMSTGDATVKLVCAVGARTDKGVHPEAGFYNSIPLDFARDVSPFGQLPALGDVFYIACDTAFGIAGANVTLTFAFTQPGGVQGTTLEWLIPLVFIVLLIPALPLFALREEELFRLGAEG